MAQASGTRTQPVLGPPDELGAREILLKGCPGIFWLLPEGQACLLAPGVQGTPQEPGGLAWVRTLIVKPESIVVKFIPSGTPAWVQGWEGPGGGRASCGGGGVGRAQGFI